MGADKDEVLLAIGRLEGKMDGVQDHVVAVSAKVDRFGERLDTHVHSDDAHGQRAARGMADRIGSIVAWIVGIAGTAFGIYAALHPR